MVDLLNIFVDFWQNICILFIRANNRRCFSKRDLANRKEEDSLENTFSCVPKVQGKSRISQANGQRSEICACDLKAVLSGGLLYLIVSIRNYQ